MSEDGNEKQIESGISAMRREYYASVRGIARCIVEDLIREQRFDASDLDDRIRETVDGNYWVIYTHANLRCMVASDNWTAIEDEVGMGEFSSMSDMTANAAYFALAADVRAELESLGVDLSDPCPDCEECGGMGEIDREPGTGRVLGVSESIRAEDVDAAECAACGGRGFAFPSMPAESK